MIYFRFKTKKRSRSYVIQKKCPVDQWTTLNHSMRSSHCLTIRFKKKLKNYAVPYMDGVFNDQHILVGKE